MIVRLSVTVLSPPKLHELQPPKSGMAKAYGYAQVIGYIA